MVGVNVPEKIIDTLVIAPKSLAEERTGTPITERLLRQVAMTPSPIARSCAFLVIRILERTEAEALNEVKIDNNPHPRAGLRMSVVWRRAKGWEILAKSTDYLPRSSSNSWRRRPSTA